LIKAKKAGLKEITFGLITSLSLFGIISLIYIIAFRLPIFMVFLPFLVYLVTANSGSYKMKYFSMILLISIGLTCVLGVIFNDIVFGLIDYLGIEIYY
jgi:hypothetical protein